MKRGPMGGGPSALCLGRGGAIRTPDLLNPIQARYRAALRPDGICKYTQNHLKRQIYQPAELCRSPHLRRREGRGRKGMRSTHQAANAFHGPFQIVHAGGIGKPHMPLAGLAKGNARGGGNVRLLQ